MLKATLATFGLLAALLLGACGDDGTAPPPEDPAAGTAPPPAEPAPGTTPPPAD